MVVTLPFVEIVGSRPLFDELEVVLAEEFQNFYVIFSLGWRVSGGVGRVGLA